MRPQTLASRFFFLAAVLLLSATLLGAQTASQKFASSADAYDDMNFQWLPWLGCWELVVEDSEKIRKGAPPRPPRLDEMPEFDESVGPELADEPLVCFLPDPDSPDGQGMHMTTLAGDEVFLRKTLLANGSRQMIDEGNCKGWQRAEWSNDSRRLFIESRLTCAGNARSISGVSLMTGRSSWTDIQVVEAGSQRELVVRHYKPTNTDLSEMDGLDVLTPERLGAAARARRQISRPLILNDIVEASTRIEPEAVEAALLESDTELDVTSDVLIEMDEAGVPGNVIDLTVALAYPDYFTVRRSTEGDAPSYGGYPPAGGGPWYGYPYPYYAVPFSYGYWYAPRSSTIVIVDAPGVERGRVVKGIGYTRVRSVSTGGRGFGGSRGSGNSWSGGSSSGSGNSASSGGGYRSGGSSSGRTAKPRNKN